MSEPHSALIAAITEAINEDGFSGGPDKRKRDGRMTFWCPDCSSGDDQSHDADCRWLRDHRLLERALAALRGE